MARVAYLADGQAEGLDTEGGRWQSVCRYHGAILSLDTRAMAQDEVNVANRLGTCAEWCEECREADEADEARGLVAFPTLALSVAFGSSEAPTEHGWSVSWYDPSSGGWYDYDSCNTAEGLPSIVARLESNARPYPCPRYRVTFEASWEVEGE